MHIFVHYQHSGAQPNMLLLHVYIYVVVCHWRFGISRDDVDDVFIKSRYTAYQRRTRSTDHCHQQLDKLVVIFPVCIRFRHINKNRINYCKDCKDWNCKICFGVAILGLLWRLESILQRVMLLYSLLITLLVTDDIRFLLQFAWVV